MKYPGYQHPAHSGVFSSQKRVVGQFELSTVSTIVSDSGITGCMAKRDVNQLAADILRAATGEPPSLTPNGKLVRPKRAGRRSKPRRFESSREAR
jgi:hypothetical protein